MDIKQREKLAEFVAWSKGFMEECDYEKWGLAAAAALAEIERLEAFSAAVSRKLDAYTDRMIAAGLMT
jgi:hypothetical protein